MENLENAWNKITLEHWWDVENFVRQLIDTANNTKEEVTGVAKWIELTVVPWSDVTVNILLDYYYDEIDRRRKAFAEETKERKKDMQKKITELVSWLSGLDFSDYETVLDWICDFQEASDQIGVSYKKRKIISIFKKQGYTILANISDDFDWEDAENFAKYVVWLALNWVNSGNVVTPAVHQFTNEWKQKFGKQAQADNARINEIRDSLK